MPPLLVSLTLIIGFILDRGFPIEILKSLLSFETRLLIGIALASTGVLFVLTAVLNFHKIGTNVPAYMPSLKLAIRGIYAYTRNPIYVGFAFLIAGVGVGFASTWISLLLLPYSLIIHYGIILREERYLENKFGADYRQYKSNTPRYGWKF